MLAERFGELGSSTRQALAHGIGTQAEDRRDLARLHAFDADEQRDLAIGGRQRGKRALERELRLRIGEGFERRAIGGRDITFGEITGERLANRLRAAPADDQRVRHREQPGGKARIGGELLGMLGEPHERLLQEVFREIPAPRHAHEVGVQPSTIRGKHRVERSGFAASQPVAPGPLVGIHADRERLTCPSVTQKKILSRRAGWGVLLITMLDFFKAGGFNMIPLTVIGIVMLVTGIKFARNADAQRLSLIRALTTTIVFCTIIGVAAGLASTAKFVVNVPEAQKDPLPYLLMGFAETMTNVILGGSFAVLTWILVAFGVRRMPKEN